MDSTVKWNEPEGSHQDSLESKFNSNYLSPLQNQNHNQQRHNPSTTCASVLSTRKKQRAQSLSMPAPASMQDLRKLRFGSIIRELPGNNMTMSYSLLREATMSHMR